MSVGELSLRGTGVVEATFSNIPSHRLRTWSSVSLPTRRVSPSNLGPTSVWEPFKEMQRPREPYVVLAQVSYRLNDTVLTDQSNGALLEVDTVDSCPRSQRPGV